VPAPVPGAVASTVRPPSGASSGGSVRTYVDVPPGVHMRRCGNVTACDRGPPRSPRSRRRPPRRVVICRPEPSVSRPTDSGTHLRVDVARNRNRSRSQSLVNRRAACAFDLSDETLPSVCPSETSNPLGSTRPMLSITAATLGLALVILPPGMALVWSLARRGTPWWEAAAVVPTVGLGFAYVVAQTSLLLSVPYSISVFVGALGILAIAIASLRRRKRGGGPTIAGPDRSDVAAIALLALAVTIGSVMWATGLRGVEVPPNSDAAHHGLFTKQIDRFETIDPDIVLASSSDGSEAFSSFYPLALHSAAALAAKQSTTSIADIWLVYAWIFAAVVFPLGIFALTRHVFPRHPLAAGFAAFLAPTLAIFPYKPFAWGGIALIAGMALAPGAIVVVARTLSDRPRVSTIALSAMTLVGLFVTHSSELPLVLALAVLAQRRSADRPATGSRVKHLIFSGAAIGMIALILLFPTLPSILEGGTERAAFDDKPVAALNWTLRTLLDLTAFTGLPATWLVVLAAAGVAITMVRKESLSWFLGGVALLMLYVAVSVSDNAVAATLSFPWFRQPERILYNVVYWILPYAGVALATIAAWGFNSAAGTRDFRARPALVATLGVGLMLWFAWGSAHVIPTQIRSWTAAYSPVGADELAAFDFLASEVPSDQPVLTDLNADGSLWMYALNGVDPLFLTAVPTTSQLPIPNSVTARHLRRQELVLELAEYRTNPNIARELKALGIRYVYYDETGYAGRFRTMNIDRIRIDPAFIPVFNRGAVHVFRIEQSAMDDPERYPVSRQILGDGAFGNGLESWMYESQTGFLPARKGTADPVLSIRDITGQSVLYAAEATDGSRTYDEFPVLEGEAYAATITIRTTDSVTGSVTFGLSFFDTAGEWIGTGGVHVADLGALQPYVDKQVSNRFRVPKDAVRAIPVIVAFSLDGEIFINDADLRLVYPE